MSDASEQARSSSLDHWLGFIRLVYFTRFSILGSGALLLLGALPLLGSGTINAVYIQANSWRMLTLTWLSFVAAALVVMTFRTTVFNAEARFDDQEMRRFADPTWGRRVRQFSWLVLGLPLPLAAFVCTYREHSGWLHFASFAIGVLAAIVTLIALERIHLWCVTENIYDANFFPLHWDSILALLSGSRREDRPSDSRLSPKALAIGLFIAYLHAKLGLRRGYLRWHSVKVQGEEEDRRVELPAVGHVTLTLLTSFLLAVNLLVLFFGPTMIRAGWIPDDDTAFGTLFYLVGLVMLLTGTLNGLAFFFDRYRFPVSWFVILMVVGLNLLNSVGHFIVDHEYDVAHAPIYASSELATALKADGKDVIIAQDFKNQTLEFEDVITGWKLRQERLAKRYGTQPNKTFIVVTAAGGGIQASGWTTTVLKGIGEDGQILGAIGVISGVSGGSVGTLQFVARYPEMIQAIADDNEKLKETLLEEANDQASRSSLEAVGWGLLFPDTWRNVGLVRDATYDRGWVQEQVWANRMISEKIVDSSHRADWRMGHLAHRVQTGDLPAVVFNAFSTTTGQRIWMAPFRMRDATDSRELHDFLEFSPAAGMQLRLATAARISATFPYVSPTTIAGCFDPQEDNLGLTTHYLQNCHLADGGYTDNEGLMTALQIVRRLEDYYDEHEADCPFDRVLLLRIAPFPRYGSLTEESWAKNRERMEVKRDSAIVQGVIGPALGLYHGRVNTQLERGEFELKAFDDIFDARREMFRELSKGNTGGRYSFRRDRNTQKIALQRTDDERQPLRFEHTLVDFRLISVDGITADPPLSWKLSQRQKNDLDRAWANWSADLNLGLALVKIPGQTAIPAMVDARGDGGGDAADTQAKAAYMDDDESEPNLQKLQWQFRGE